MKLYHIVLLAIMALILPSCEDFLREEPKDEFSVDQYFSDPDHAISAVNGLYSQLLNPLTLNNT